MATNNYYDHSKTTDNIKLIFLRHAEMFLLWDVVPGQKRIIRNNWKKVFMNLSNTAFKKLEEYGLLK